jgi:hypothetical protein
MGPTVAQEVMAEADPEAVLLGTAPVAQTHAAAVPMTAEMLIYAVLVATIPGRHQVVVVQVRAVVPAEV